MKKKPPVINRKVIAAYKDIYGDRDKAAKRYNEMYGNTNMNKKEGTKYDS